MQSWNIKYSGKRLVGHPLIQPGLEKKLNGHTVLAPKWAITVYAECNCSAKTTLRPETVLNGRTRFVCFTSKRSEGKVRKEARGREGADHSAQAAAFPAVCSVQTPLASSPRGSRLLAFQALLCGTSTTINPSRRGVEETALLQGNQCHFQCCTICSACGWHCLHHPRMALDTQRQGDEQRRHRFMDETRATTLFTLKGLDKAEAWS